jgi:hypothetical protein
MIWVTIADHTGERFLTEVKGLREATAASLSSKVSDEDALMQIRSHIESGIPLDCKKLGDDRANIIALFMGPVTLSISNLPVTESY